MVFFTYKYLNMETKHLKIISNFLTNIRKRVIVVYVFCFFLVMRKDKQKEEEPQAEIAANPWYQEEEKKWHRLTCA